ncbi:MAG: hypothetical protein RR273_02700 [Oscillospiraceae bacterium]
MKKYVIKIFSFLTMLLFITAATIGLTVFDFPAKIMTVATDTGDFYYDFWTQQSKGALDIVQNNTDKKTLIIGDSVANQIFSGIEKDNKEYYVATTNSGLLLLGQYIFAAEAVKNNPQLDKIILALRPFSFQEKIDVNYSYAFIAYPLYRDEYKRYFDEQAVQEFEKIFSQMAMTEAFQNVYGKSPIIKKMFLNCCKMADDKKNTNKSVEPVSDISVRYVLKLVQLCKENGVELSIIPCPMSTEYSEKEMQELKIVFEEKGILKYIPDYFEQIEYYSIDKFSDSTHFSDMDGMRKIILDDIKSKTGEFQNLVY